MLYTNRQLGFSPQKGKDEELRQENSEEKTPNYQTNERIQATSRYDTDLLIFQADVKTT